MKRWLKRIGLFVLLMVMVNVAIVIYMHYTTRGKALDELRGLVDELDAAEPDWQWDANEAKRKLDLPDEQNVAWLGMQVEKTRHPLPTGPTSPDMILANEISKVRFTPEMQLDEIDAQTLRVMLEQAEPAMAFVRKLPQVRRGYYPIKLAPDLFSTQLPQMEAYRQLLIYLSAQAYLAMQDGKMSEAAEHIRVMLQTTAAIGEEPFVVLQLVRLACADISRNALERLLAQGEVTDAELATLQAMLETERNFPCVATVIRGERGAVHVLMTNYENGTLPIFSTMAKYGGNSLVNPLPLMGEWRLGRYVPANHVFLLKLYAGCLEMEKLPWWEQVAALEAIEMPPIRPEWFLVQLFIPKIHHLHRAEMRTRAQLTTLMVGVAAERYRLKTGHWPKSDEELVPVFLPERPRDPYTGRPIMIRAYKEGITVYSTGPDGIDDDGYLWRDGATSNTDYGFRMWDVSERRQPPFSREPEQLEVMPHEPIVEDEVELP